MYKKFSPINFLWLGTILLILLLVACGGSADEAVEDTSTTDSGAADEATESESIADGGVSATGSEEDSGELPPTPEPGSKVESVRGTGNGIAASETAVANPTPATNRIDSGEPAAARPIDLVLLIDATGSMHQELQSLQSGLPFLADNLTSLPENTDFQFGFVLYRDRGKADSVEIFDLTDDWTLFVANLEAVTAVGGGDYAEDLDSGFYRAVTTMNWRPGAEKIIILVGDAPPQTTSNNSTPYTETLLLAAEKEIKIFTIGGDGLDENGKSIFQQIAQQSNGRFLMLTDSPETVANGETAVYPIAELPTALVDIILEVANAPAR
ncbi:MAG: VWA domain-containing protein [Ardenticatenaceae bacterium]|nr:VWA domain-containing protein [Ardenticatenaceae bacterium]